MELRKKPFSTQHIPVKSGLPERQRGLEVSRESGPVTEGPSG